MSEQTLIELAAEITKTSPYENLVEILGGDMGHAIYNLVNYIKENAFE